VKDPRNDPVMGPPSTTGGSITLSLLARLKAHDPEGWRRLSQLYCPLVYRWCLRGRLQPQDAYDVVQEVFRTVAMKIHSFRRERPNDTFRGWLWTITRHKLGDYYRRQRAQAPASGGSDAMAMMLQIPQEESTDNDGFLESGDASSLYHRALKLICQEFSEKTWKAFWRVVVEDQPPALVAQELGMSTNAIYIAKSRVLARLREELGDEDPTT